MDYLTMDENVCPVCGKVFYTPLGRDWGWHYKGNNYCSYHCMRHVEVRHRVRNGWGVRNYYGYIYSIDERAQGVAEDLRTTRHLVQAAKHLKQAADEQTGERSKAILALQKSVDKKAAAMWSVHEQSVAELDDAKRELVCQLFWEAQPFAEVAAKHHIDTDLMGVKLCMAYDAIARRE